MPRVSVLMPVFNAERYVESAVRSVLSQTFRDFELLIIDDGSTDRSLSMLKQFANRDSRVRLTSRANVGLVPTLNELLKAARGELVARMDADDLCRPNRFERQCAFLDENPACVAVGSRALFIDPEGLPIFEFIVNFSHEDVDAALLKPEIGILHPSVMIRRDVALSLGGYRPDFPHVEDLDLFLRLAEVGKVANVPDILLEYRVHASSVSHKYTVTQSISGRRAVESAVQRRGLDPRTVSADASVVLIGETTAQLHRKWSWWALGAGNLAAARKHAFIAIKSEPLSKHNARMAACVLRDSIKSMF